MEQLVYFPQPCHHFVYRFVRCGGARRYPRAVLPRQPGGVYLLRPLDLVRLHARAGAGLGQLARVGAVAAAGHDEQVALSRQLARGVVPLVGLRAGRVHHPKLVYAADVVADEARHELRERLLALGCLGQEGHLPARDIDLRLGVKDGRANAVHPGQYAPDLRMVLLAVDYHLEPVVAQGSRRLLRLPDDRTGSVDETKPALRRLVRDLRPAPVGRDGDGLAATLGEPADDADSARGEAVHDDRVVDDRTQAIDGPTLFGGRRHYVDRAANTEAEPQRFRSDNPHFRSSRRLPMTVPARPPTSRPPPPSPTAAPPPSAPPP